MKLANIILKNMKKLCSFDIVRLMSSKFIFSLNMFVSVHGSNSYIQYQIIVSNMIQIQQKGYFNSISEFHIFEDKVLGQGSFGVVKLACHIRASKLYAIKIVNLNILQEEPMIAKILQRENYIHNRLQHPHIVKLWDSFIEDGQLYMVMEYLQKGNLFHHQNKHHRFTEPQAFKFFYQSMLALKYLHKRKIIHRDLKPQNLLLDSDENVKLCDFGWAAILISGNRTTFCGTYEYMAPEIVFEKKYNQKVDIWALGILLYELLHGYAPFMADVLPELKEKMWEGSFQILEHLSQQCADLITLLLKFDQNQRLTIEEIEKHAWVTKLESYFRYNHKNKNVSNGPFKEQRRQKISISTKMLSPGPYNTIQHYKCQQLTKNNSSPCLELASNDQSNSLQRLITYKEIGNISTNNTINVRKVRIHGEQTQKSQKSMNPFNIVGNSPSSKRIKIKNKVSPEVTVFQTKNYVDELPTLEKHTAKRKKNENIFIRNYQADPQSTPILVKKKKSKGIKNTYSPNIVKRNAVSINQFKIQAKKLYIANSKSKSKSKQRSNQKDKSKSKSKSKSKEKEKQKSKSKQKSKQIKVNKFYNPFMYTMNRYKMQSPLTLTPTPINRHQKKRIL